MALNTAESYTSNRLEETVSGMALCIHYEKRIDYVRAEQRKKA